jgi:hypothetical protein
MGMHLELTWNFSEVFFYPEVIRFSSFLIDKFKKLFVARPFRTLPGRRMDESRPK